MAPSSYRFSAFYAARFARPASIAWMVSAVLRTALARKPKFVIADL